MFDSLAFLCLLCQELCELCSTNDFIFGARFLKLAEMQEEIVPLKKKLEYYLDLTPVIIFSLFFYICSQINFNGLQKYKGNCCMFQ